MKLGYTVDRGAQVELKSERVQAPGRRRQPHPPSQLLPRRLHQLCGAPTVHGRAVQVDPIKPTLKPTGAKRLKLKCDVLLSASAFDFNLRRYTTGGNRDKSQVGSTPGQGLTLVHNSARLERFYWDRGRAQGLCSPC